MSRLILEPSRLILDWPNRNGFAFSRSGSATRIGNDGVLYTDGDGVPRHQNFPTDNLGIVRQTTLLELASTNLLLYSEEFNSGPWPGASLTVNVTANQLVTPDGTTTADLVEGTTSDSQINQNAITATAGTVHTFSVWLRSVSGSQGMAIRLCKESDGVAYASTIMTLSTTWTRYTVTGTVPAGQTALRVRIGGGSVWASGVQFYAWGAQLEVQPIATSYVKTTTAAVTRAVDIATLPFPSQVQEMSGMVEFVEGGMVEFVEGGTLGLGPNSRLFYIGGTTNPRLIVRRSFAGLWYDFTAFNTSAAESSTAGTDASPIIGDYVRFWWWLEINGTQWRTNIRQAIGSGSFGTLKQGSLQTIEAPLLSGAAYTINCSPLGTNAGRNNHIRHRVYAGYVPAEAF